MDCNNLYNNIMFIINIQGFFNQFFNLDFSNDSRQMQSWSTIMFYACFHCWKNKLRINSNNLMFHRSLNFEPRLWNDWKVSSSTFRFCWKKFFMFKRGPLFIEWLILFYLLLELIPDWLILFYYSWRNRESFWLRITSDWMNKEKI